MEAIIFGGDKPKLSFTQSPSGSLDVEIENDTVLTFPEGMPDTVNWADVYVKVVKDFAWKDEKEEPLTVTENWDEDRRENILRSLGKDLLGYVETSEEKKFLAFYIEACIEAVGEPNRGGSWVLPALIPQVWVNWIHYDPKDEERARRSEEEPFRVDFMVKDPEISDKPVIIEIDGASHFGNYTTDAAGQVTLQASMEAYTEHLKKDRWLRDKGWPVYRISSLEVNNMEDLSDFKSFYPELVGRAIGLPF